MSTRCHPRLSRPRNAWGVSLLRSLLSPIISALMDPVSISVFGDYVVPGADPQLYSVNALSVTV